MIKLFAMTAALVTLSVAAADANAWTRKGSFTGPRGTYTVQGSGSCVDRVCTRQITRIGPYGRSMSRQGTLSCADGTCTGSRMTTGPRGRTFYRQGSISR